MAVSYTTTTGSPAGVQGSYELNLTKGHEGMLGNAASYTALAYENESGAVIPFGHAVINNGSGTADLSAKLPAGASATQVVGIALDSLTFVLDDNAKTADGRKGYPAEKACNILSEGIAYVYSAHAVSVGDDVRLFHTNSASVGSNSGYAGRFGKTAEAGKTFSVSGARWLSSCAAGGIALLEIDAAALSVTADT
ncbi:MAG: hypothetical protein CL532_01305 [Aestuariivita sp.]|nr:hypothetical protein [Aestuariivita sp.]